MILELNIATKIKNTPILLNQVILTIITWWSCRSDPLANGKIWGDFKILTPLTNRDLQQRGNIRRIFTN